MPDVWTANPKKLKFALELLGAKCGVEPRVLKPRDPEWTCYVDTPNWRGDIYLHPAEEFYWSPLYYSPVVILHILGIFLGLVWGRSFWRA